MTEAPPSLEEAYGSLKTPQARAGAVFELVTRPSETQAIEIDGLMGDSLKMGIGIAFQQGDFERGFAMAEKGRILEEIIVEVNQAPTSLINNWSWTEDEREHQGIPESVRNLPGFNYDFNESDYSGDRIKKVMPWVKKLKTALVKEVLIPSERYQEAVEQMQHIGDMEKEITEIALGHFSDLAAARVVVQTGLGFSEIISRAEQHKKSKLANLLKKRHVKSLLESRKRVDGWHGRWRKGRDIGNAVSHAKHYFGPEKAGEILERGTNLAISDFKTELEDWRRELDSASSGRHSRDPMHSYEREWALKRARTRFTESPSESAKMAIELISKMPAEKKPELKQKLYDACKGSSFDALGIARAMGDSKGILEHGLWALRVTNSSHWVDRDGTRPTVQGILRHRISQGTTEEKLKYVNTLKEKRETIQEAKELGISRDLLGDWLKKTREYKKSLREDLQARGFASRNLFYPVNVAHLASQCGKRLLARKYYIKAKEFKQAAEHSDKPIDQASLLLRQAIKTIDHRFQFSHSGGHSSKPPSYYGQNRMDAEIELMAQSMRLVRGEKGNKTEYHTQALNLARFLFEKAEYQEGVLFLKRARIPSKLTATVLQGDILETAEASQNFAGCYWLSRLGKDEIQAANYKVLAEAMKQPIRENLDSYVSKAAKTSRRKGKPEPSPF